MSLKTRLQVHATQRVSIKVADVDRKMVPLVNWLNSFEEVTTLWCCEGEPRVEGKEAKAQDQPYVMFTCTSLAVLILILDVIRIWGNTGVHWEPETGQLTYRTEFVDQRALADVCSRARHLERKHQ
jgi:hypothetical protein